MAQTSFTGLVAGSSTPLLATGDVMAWVDISDTTQSPSGSLVKTTVADWYAALPSAVNILSASANALAVGRLGGTTTPAFVVDASTASQVAGLKVVGAATGGTVAVVAIDSGADTNLTVNAKGTGTIGIGSVSTGRVTITPVTTITGSLTLSAALTYGGVTLSNTVTGTGAMVLATSPTVSTLTVSGGGIALTGASIFSSTINSQTISASANFTGTVTVATGLTVSAGSTIVQAMSATTGIFTAGLVASGSALPTAANQIGLDESGGYGRLLSYGANASTNGSFKVVSLRSDGSSAANLIVLDGSTLLATFGGGISATTGTLSSTLTYGGVTLSAAVTGTGSMVLSASPTLTGTVTVSGGIRTTTGSVAIQSTPTTVYTPAASGYYTVFVHNSGAGTTNSTAVVNLFYSNGTAYISGTPVLGSLMAASMSGNALQLSNSAGPVAENYSVIYYPIA